MRRRAPRVEIGRDGRLYRLAAPRLGEPIRHRDPVHAVCDFVVHLVHGYVDAHPSVLCLHSAAARMEGRLVVFPNVYRGGKSLLVAHLAAAGVEIFSDDVVPVLPRPERGVALGIAPRLRLPLPDGVTPEFERFLAGARGPASARYQYLALGRSVLAPLGTSAPIGAFVLLDRRSGSGAELEPMDRAEALRRVIQRNFARRLPARRIMDRLERLVMKTACFRLRYDGAESATALLKARFAGQPFPSRRRRATAEIKARAGNAPPRPAAGTWRHRAAVQERRVGNELFLVNGESDSIYHLNALGAALWRLSKEAMTEPEMVEIVAMAFPEAERARIARDIRRLLKTLEAKGLIGPSP